MAPSPLQRVKVPENRVLAQIIDGEAIIINMETGCYYSLDSVGAEIWRCIEDAPTLPEIVRVVRGCYDCRAANVTEEVERLLAELRSEELIETFVDGCEKESVEPPGGQNDGERAAFESPRLEKHSDMREFLLVDPIHHIDDRGWPHKAKS